MKVNLNEKYSPVVYPKFECYKINCLLQIMYCTVLLQIVIFSIERIEIANQIRTGIKSMTNWQVLAPLWVTVTFTWVEHYPTWMYQRKYSREATMKPYCGPWQQLKKLGGKVRDAQGQDDTKIWSNSIRGCTGPDWLTDWVANYWDEIH